MGSLFSELKRRKVFRVTAAYLVGAWAILEFVSVVSPMLRLPEWAGPLVLVLLTIGLVVAVALSWMFEVTADGLRRTEPAAASGGPAISKFDWALMVASVAIIALVSYQQIFARAGSAGESSAGSAPAGSISIAVLPFVNLSGDPGQEFFSDGMTEEITSALAKVTGLQVVGRTSAFEFKGQNKDLNAIGKALRATHLLEGSVRKSGNRVRITGQLIRADTGTHVWTENYDRELTDIFVTQDDIAKAIAGALQVPLGLKAGETLVANRAISPENYQMYLHARAIYRARVTPKDNLDASNIGEQLVELEPSYAPAWSLLAEAYVGAPAYTFGLGTVEEYRQRVDASLTKAEAAGRRAIALEPQNAGSYAGLAAVLHRRGKYVEAEDLFKQALKIDAFNPDLLHHYRLSLLFNGRIKEAVTVSQQLRSLEPLVPRFNMWLSEALVTAGQYEAALAIAKTLPIEDGDRLHLLLRANIFLGRGGDAADVILGSPARFKPDVAAAVIQFLRMPPVTVPPQDLPELPSAFAAVYLYVGATEPYFQTQFSRAERYIDAGYYFAGHDLWEPSLAPARKTERFKALMRKAGLVDYWRARLAGPVPSSRHRRL